MTCDSCSAAIIGCAAFATYCCRCPGYIQICKACEAVRGEKWRAVARHEATHEEVAR